MTTEKETFVINKVCRIHNIDINNIQTSTEHNIMCAIRDTYLFVKRLHDEEINFIKTNLDICNLNKDNIFKALEEKDKEILDLKYKNNNLFINCNKLHEENQRLSRNNI